MFPSASDSLDFPARRSNASAEWLPIYLEPMIGSGERICTAVIASNASGFEIVSVPSLDRLSCLYGAQAAAIINANKLIIEAVSARVTQRGISALSGWDSPIEGVTLGKIRRGAGESLKDVARNGLLQCASLAEILSEEEETAEASARSEVSSRRLEKFIRESVVAERPDLNKRFDKKYQVSKRARSMRIGFTGDKIVANFGLLVPGQLSVLVNSAKAKLWDLEQIRGGAVSDMYKDDSHPSFELLLYRIPKDSPQYSDRQLASVEEAGVELEEEADRVEIRARQMTSHQEISMHVIKSEAA